MAVKNVVFNVAANTNAATQSLAKLVAELEKIKKNASISIAPSTGNLDAQLTAISKKLDEIAAKNVARSNKETATVINNNKKKAQSDIDIILQEEAQNKKKQDDINAAYNQLAQIQNENQKSLTKAFNERIAAENKAVKDGESQKQKDLKQAFDAKDKVLKESNKSAEKATNEEIKIYEGGQKEKIQTQQKSQEELDKERDNFVKDEQKRFDKQLKQQKDLSDELRKFTQQEQADIDKARDNERKKAEKEAKASEKTKRAEEFKASPYGQLIQQTQAATEKARQLGAQLILLEQAGQKNSSTYRTLAAEYTKVKAEADKAAASLKNLNSNVNLKPQTQNFTGLAGSINFLSRAVANSSTNFVRLRNVIARTGVALGAVSLGAAVFSIGRAAIKAASDYEVLSVSFGTLIGNTTLATAKIKELREFAAATPFTTEDVFQASRTLLGYGLEVGRLIPTIKTLGDVAGGVGVPLERVALVFGQVRAAGRLYGQDLLQLVTLGFNPLSEIARTTGESFDSLKDKMRKGQITFDDVNGAFITATSEGGKFYNLTNALANTTTAQLARLNEEWTILLTKVGLGLKPAFEGLISVGRFLLEFFSNLPKIVRENAVSFTLLTSVTTALTAALFANSLNLVANSVKTVFNTGAKVANRIATAAMAGVNVIATRGLTAQTVAQAALTTGTRIGTSALNAFKAAWVSNPLGLIITLLATAATAWYAFGDAVDTATDNFIDADEALNELKLTSQKATDAELKTLKESIEAAKNIGKPLKDRQKIIDEINKKYERSVELTGDEKKDVIILNGLYQDLEGAITDVNKAKAAAPLREKLNQQIADVQLELLNLASEGGVNIPISLITNDKEIQGGFKETINLIKGQYDKLSAAAPNPIKEYVDETIAYLPSFLQIDSQLENIGQNLSNKVTLQQKNAVELLNVQLDKLITSYGILGALDEEIKGLPDSFTPKGTGKTQAEIDAEKEAEKKRLQQLKDYNKELSDLFNRIAKNNEDFRKQTIEFQFIDSANFEEEVAKLKLLDKINEETVNREIDREIESVRQKELTEGQKTKLIEQLEIIRNQEQQKRAFTLQERIYEIERDGVAARRKIYFELQELEREYYRDSLRFQLDKLTEFSQQANDLIEDALTPSNVPFERSVIGFPLIARPNNFDFEDIVQLPIEAIEDLKRRITLFDNSLDNLFADDPETLNRHIFLRNLYIDEFNDTYGTTLGYVQNERELNDELSKSYDKQVKALQSLNQEQKQLNIYRFARQFVKGEVTLTPFLEERKNETKDYLETLAEIYESDKKSVIEQRDFDLNQFGVSESDKVRIKGEANDNLKRLDDQFSKDKKDRQQSDSDFEKNLIAKLYDLYEEDKIARINAIEEIKDSFLDFTKVFIEGQIQQTEAAISAQERRVQAAKDIADKGNVVLLKAEQERLDKLNRQRAEFVRKQQALAAIEIAVNSAIAVAKAAGQPGAPFTVAAILAAMAVGFAQAKAQAQAASTFAKGGYTGDGHQFQEAGTVHKGEFVINAEKTRQYRPLLEAIHAGRNPKALQSVQDRMLVVNTKSTDERLERIERAIVGQKGLQLSIDENGINGIVSRISYKQQRINNRAR